MKFRCGYCLKEKEEDEPKKFHLAWSSPLGRKPGFFYLCEKCKKNLKPAKTPVYNADDIQPPKPSLPIPNLIFFMKKFAKPKP